MKLNQTMRIISTAALVLFILHAAAQTAKQEGDAGSAEPMFTMPVKDLCEIPFSGKDDDIMFIVPALYHEPRSFGTIGVMPQAGAYRIHFPEPKSAR